MINSFRGKYAAFSNFAAFPIRLGGVVYPTAEHAFQAAKTLNLTERCLIRDARSPAEAKRLGKKVTLRPGWNELRVDVMTAIVEQKFRVHPACRELLLSTGEEELVEGNTWGDRFWGAVWDGKEWVGWNHLGRCLMAARKKLRDTA